MKEMCKDVSTIIVISFDPNKLVINFLWQMIQCTVSHTMCVNSCAKTFMSVLHANRFVKDLSH